MATKAQKFRSEEQRKSHDKPTSKRKPKKSAWSHDKAHAGSKATHAFEEKGAGKPSRESTRKGANRTKADAARNITEEVRKDAPRARANRSRDQGKKVRGH